MNHSLRTSILSTLSYFDQFHLPLTAEELYRALWKPEHHLSFEEFIGTLPSLPEIETKGGYWFLLGRGKELTVFRESSMRLREAKMRRAVRGVKTMAWLPFVQAVFVCNTLALGTNTSESDIDLFIVVQEKRLWLTRLLVTGVLSLFGFRRHGARITDRLCLSFYVTDTHLNLSSVRLHDEDIYLAYWIAHLIPVYDEDAIREKILAENRWVFDLLPYTSPSYIAAKRWRVTLSSFSGSIKKTGELCFAGRVGGMFESRAKKMQQNIMQRKKESLREVGDTRVVVTDTMLKFHENDRRLFFEERWREILSRVV